LRLITYKRGIKMTDPITLTLVGTVVLTEGIKFLYGQAGELLKRWRDRKDAAAPEAAQPIETPLKAAPEIFAGTIAPLVADVDRLRSLEPELRKLRSALANYADGIDKIDASDNRLVSVVDALRQQLETVYGQRITFRGEQREPSGTPLVVGTAELKRIAGLAAGVIGGTVTEGEVRGKVTAEEVVSGGVAAGVKLDKIGR
jgi:hypothetical protein